MLMLRFDLKTMVSASRNYVVKINNGGQHTFRIFKLPNYLPNNGEAAAAVLKQVFGDEMLSCVDDLFTLELINSAVPLTLDDAPPPPCSLPFPSFETFFNEPNVKLAS